MKHRVAVGAHGSEIGDRIYLVFSTCLRDLLKVMHVDELRANLPVHLDKSQIADLAHWTVVGDASRASTFVALVPIHVYP